MGFGFRGNISLDRVRTEFNESGFKPDITGRVRVKGLSVNADGARIQKSGNL